MFHVKDREKGDIRQLASSRRCRLPAYTACPNQFSFLIPNFKAPKGASPSEESDEAACERSGRRAKRRKGRGGKLTGTINYSARVTGGRLQKVHPQLRWNGWWRRGNRVPLPRHQLTVPARLFFSPFFPFKSASDSLPRCYFEIKITATTRELDFASRLAGGRKDGRRPIRC